MLARKEHSGCIIWFDTSTVCVAEPIQGAWVITPKSGNKVVVTTRRSRKFKVFVANWVHHIQG